MAKKTTNTKKTTGKTASTKKTTAKKSTASAKKTATSAKETTAAVEGSSPAVTRKRQSAARAANVPLITANVNDNFIRFVTEEDMNSELTGAERRRLIGAGVRNYGFIEKSWDICRDNPEMRPQLFDYDAFGAGIAEFDKYRQLFFLLQKFLAAVNEAMLVRSDALYREALRVYGNLKELAHSRVPGALPLFRALHPFFARARHPEQGEDITIEEEIRDATKLIRGKADGEMIIKNEKPRAVKGTRTVIDEVNKGRAAIKKTDETDIDE